MNIRARKGFIAVIWVVFLLVTVSSQAWSAVQPWCKAEGDPNHPLSLEHMGLGPLLDRETRRDRGKMVRAVYAAYQRAQEEVMAARNEAPLAESEAFERILRRLLEGEVTALTPFRFKLAERGRVNRLVDDAYPGGELRFTCSDESPRELARTNPQKANIGYTAFLLQVLLSEQLEPLMKIYARRLDERSTSWEAYLKNGLPMWPWELVVNSWGEDYHDLAAGPPRWQWVVMRPSAGFEIYWPNRKDATLEASVAVEPIGFVRYTDVKTYRQWWGLSALVTLGSDDNGVGLGGLLRYNNYALGVVRRRDVDDSYVFLSFDLYEKVRETRVRAEEARARLEALKQKWAQYKQEGGD